MLKQFSCVLLIVLVFAVCLTGCGSGNETSGSISMSAPINAGGVVKAAAIYKPASGSALPNQEITFYWRTVGQTSNIELVYPPANADTDTTGTATSELTLPSPQTEILWVYVKAVTGSLTTGTQFVEVMP